MSEQLKKDNKKRYQTGDGNQVNRKKSLTLTKHSADIDRLAVFTVFIVGCMCQQNYVETKLCQFISPSVQQSVFLPG